MKTWIICLLPVWTWAQVTFELDPKEMGQNEILQWTIRLENPQPEHAVRFPQGVDSGDFDLLSHNARTVSSMSIINGKVSQVQSLIYEFRPGKQGDLEFPEQVIEYGGQEYRSPPTPIKVGPPVEGLSQAGGRRDPFDGLFRDPFDPGRRRPSQSSSRPQGEVFVRAEVSKDTFFIGELIPFRVKLYRRGVRIESMGSQMDLPSFEGFWTEELNRGPLPTTRERVDDKLYEVNVVHERNLFANRIGTMVIQPTVFDLNVSAGGFFSNWQRVERRTEPIELHIEPLPDRDVPPEFSGAVGRFQLIAELDPPRTPAGEATSLRIQVTGLGNFAVLQSFQLPELDPSVELFEGGTPQLTKTQGIITGKTWVYALVPKREGEIIIPEIALAYFDPETRRYHRVSQGPFSLEVLPGEGLPDVPQAQTEPETIAKGDESLRYIKLTPRGAVNQARDLPRAAHLLTLIWTFLALDAVAALVVFVQRRRISRKDELRPRNAWRNFKRRLTLLRRKRKKMETDAFFAELSEAVLDYFGDKWQRPGQGISMDFVAETFSAKGVPEQHTEQVVQLIEACDLARFTPNRDAARDQLLARALTAIREIEEVLS